MSVRPNGSQAFLQTLVLSLLSPYEIKKAIPQLFDDLDRGLRVIRKNIGGTRQERVSQGCRVGCDGFVDVLRHLMSIQAVKFPEDRIQRRQKGRPPLVVDALGKGTAWLRSRHMKNHARATANRNRFNSICEMNLT
jgi:hypothetical protein